MLINNNVNHQNTIQVKPFVQTNTTNSHGGNNPFAQIGGLCGCGLGGNNMMFLFLQLIIGLLSQLQGQGGQEGNTNANANPEPEPVISKADQAVIDYVEGRQGKWLVGHGQYKGKSTGQDVFTFKSGPLKGYTAHHVEGSKYEIKNPEGRVIAEHDSGKGRNKVASPVALDLNNDGKISTTGTTTAKDRLDGTQIGATVQFDIDGDGTQDTVEWMSGEDGLLVDTSKIDGNFVDGNALFGDQGGKFENGYQKMAQHDANNDGKLSGDEIANLGVWVDDGDAKLEEGELRSLSEFGITELSTQKQDVKNDRGETLMRSDAKTADGETVMTEDVWFGQK